MKFVSLSQLLGLPLFGSNSGPFIVPGFIVSLVGIKKKRRRRMRKEEEIKRGRKEEGVKKKNHLKK